MSPEARAQLIRERFKAKKPSTYVAAERRAPKPKVERQPAKPGICDSWFGSAMAWNWGKSDWLAEPEHVIEEKLRQRRKTAVSPLTLISEKLKRPETVRQDVPLRPEMF